MMAPGTVIGGTEEKPIKIGDTTEFLYNGKMLAVEITHGSIHTPIIHLRSLDLEYVFKINKSKWAEQVAILESIPVKAQETETVVDDELPF